MRTCTGPLNALGVVVAISLSACGSPPETATPARAAQPAVVSKEHAPVIPLIDVDVPWKSATPEEVGLSRPALEKIIDGCQKTDADALLVLSGDRVVVSRGFGHAPRALDTKSVTKGFVGFAVGFLVAEGKLSIDDPLSKWFPEWKEGKKAKVLLRHVLTHTSGLSHEPAAGKLERQKDRLAYVRSLELVTEPGAVFSYNNEASMLLSGIIAAAAGEPIDRYLGRRLFEPLGITDASWTKDDAGNVTTNSGLGLSAVSLAKVGVALRDGKVVPAAWIAAMQVPTKIAPWVGLLTWTLDDGPWVVQDVHRRELVASKGFSAQAKLTPLDGKRFRTRAAYWLEAGALLTPTERSELGGIVHDDVMPFAEVPAVPIGFYFDGWLGQYLVVIPKAGVVAVRQRREPPDVDDDSQAKIGMSEFPRMVRAALER